MNDAVTIRPFGDLDEYRACVGLQEDIWGAGFSERVAPAILKVSRILGGVASGAWDSRGHLVGFVFGMTGPRKGVLVHWSDMLAVRPEARGAGLGRRLKLHQRELVLEGGVRLMHWTFDPLRARNAHLNFARLGITAPEYVEDMYGQTDSPLHRGIGTDRFVARWEMDSTRVEDRLAGRGRAPTPAEVADAPFALARTPGGDADRPRPGDPALDLEEPRIRVALPPDIGVLMDADLALALAWRQATRAALSRYIGAGWTALEFVRNEPTPFYLLARRDTP